MSLTHEKAWAEKPDRAGAFVSNLVHHAYPTLNKNRNIKKILDVACGNGLGVTLPLIRKGFDVYSCDKFDSALKALRFNAEKEGLTIKEAEKTKEADMYKELPYNNNSFDAAFCFHAMYHGRLEQIMITLGEIRRVTKPGGYFFATMLNFDILRFDKTEKKYFRPIFLDGKRRKIYHEQDQHQPHLFYPLSQKYEYMVPHYYFDKAELKLIFGQYFQDIKIKMLHKKTAFHVLKTARHVLLHKKRAVNAFFLVSGKIPPKP